VRRLWPSTQASETALMVWLAREAEQLADDGGARDLDEDDVIEADLVEGVFERDAALDFVRLDHGGEDVAHGERG
jgi:hypothetical protein